MTADIYSPRPDTLPGRVIAYFRRLPDEELSVLDIALKFDANKHNIHTQLKTAHDYDILARDGQIYKAGINIGATEGGTKLTQRPVGGYLSVRHHIDMSALRVDVDVPMPARNVSGSKWDDLFAKLTTAGLSIAVPVEVKGALSAEANKRKKQNQGTYKVAKISATQARIWRLA